MRGAVQEADEWGVDPKDQVNALLPSSTKSSGCGSRQLHSFEDRQQFLHRAPELRFALLAASGRPLNSEFITRQSRSTVS
jgi:hypothetical protein